MTIFAGTTLADFMENVSEYVNVTVKHIDGGVLYEYDRKDEWDDTYDGYLLIDFFIQNARVTVWVK